jgi:hypothetical protein
MAFQELRRREMKEEVALDLRMVGLGESGLQKISALYKPRGPAAAAAALF